MSSYTMQDISMKGTERIETEQPVVRKLDPLCRKGDRAHRDWNTCSQKTRSATPKSETVEEEE